MSALGVSEETKDLTPYYHAKWEMELAVEESGLEHVIFRSWLASQRSTTTCRI